MVTSWLGQGSNSLGGNYGEATPSDLGFDITTTNGQSCEADPDLTTTVYDNSLSVLAYMSMLDKFTHFLIILQALSAAELTRRIVQFRDMPDDMKFPNSTFIDMQHIMCVFCLIYTQYITNEMLRIILFL